jgi:hypothetical protein
MPVAGHVGFDPRHASSVVAQARPGFLERGGGNVEDAHAPGALVENEIHEAGISAPDVDDSGRWPDSGRFQQPQ